MNKIEIEVPINVRYISEWNDFNTDLLKGHSIINKTITGCGFTHYCLTNSIPTILCSPRKFLLENKHEQLPNTYLVINDGEKGLSIDSDDSIGIINPVKDLLKKNLEKNEILINNFSTIQSIQDNLRSYIFNCQVSNVAPKILVTYDSLKYVVDLLRDFLQQYSIIVDEFQNIFIDASFKADIELNFVNTLQSCPNVTYLSATPYIEEYLNELDEFKLLPYYELKWHPDRLHKIKTDFKNSGKINKEIDKILQDYLLGKFPEKVDENGMVHQSKEVVFYTNSVKLITSTIKRNNLEPHQVNIICADTEKNKQSLRKIGFSIGKAPLKGEPHKMFTFCTRTTYAGADFYSTNALSVIVSDCAIDSLSTDIRMDFPQIMGRQRLKENVFRDECIFIYKLSDSAVTMDDFESISTKKLEKSERDIKAKELLNSSEVISNIVEDIRLRIKIKKYSEDYTGIDERTGLPQINKLVYISERRAFELRSNVYKSETLVYNEFNEISSMDNKFFYEKEECLSTARQMFNSVGQFGLKMKIICDILLDPQWYGKIHISDFYWIPLNYRNYLNYLGPGRMKALSFHELDIKREMESNQIQEENKMYEMLSSYFNINQRYSLREIKDKIQLIYNNLKVQKTPKATDLLEFYEVKECLITDKVTGKRVKGYEILGLK